MQPRDYQQEAVDATWSFLCRQSGHPLIVAPTGSGKSWLIAMLVAKAREIGGRVLVVAHRKELLQQNAEKLEHLLTEHVGVHSAGLGQRDTTSSVLVAGIQSIYRKADQLGERNLILIDEAHLIAVGENTMYRKLLLGFPDARVVGLTATPFRTGEGYIIGGDHLFDFISHEIKTKPLVEQGFLSPLTFKPTSEVDVSHVAVRAGEFVQGEMQAAFSVTEVAKAACHEIANLTSDRKSILVFCAGVEHAEFVQGYLEKITGGQVGCVTGNTMPIERAESLRRFREGEMRIMTNCDVLTTGFDSPRIDCIVVLRATMSPGLYAQMLGRGFRIHPGKETALVLDFGGNRRRHGSPAEDNYGASSVQSSDEPGTAPVKTCIGCKATIPAAARTCEVCGLEIAFEEHARHDEKPDVQEVTVWTVVDCFVGRHEKRGAPPGHPPTLRIDYGLREDGKSGDLVGSSASEWVCFEHTGFARSKAVKWWRLRSSHPVPSTVDEAVEMINRHACRAPSKLSTEIDGKYRRVSDIEFVDERPDVDELQPGWELIQNANEGWDESEIPF